jgi:hypothetical protein
MLRAITLCSLVLTVPTAWAAQQSPPAGEKSPAKSRSLDQQLLDDLDRQLLEGLPGNVEPVKPLAGSKSKKQGERQRAGDNLNLESQGGPQIPLAKIAQRMRAVESRIAERDTSAATQEAQQKILEDLSALLEQARRQQAASGNPSKGTGRGTAQAGAGSGNPTPGPARDSSNRIERGAKEQTETTDVKDLFRRVWGNLPDKLRDEMQASISEQFLPKYERLIEEYYKRLAEEQPGQP